MSDQTKTIIVLTGYPGSGKTFTLRGVPQGTSAKNWQVPDEDSLMKRLWVPGTYETIPHFTEKGRDGTVMPLLLNGSRIAYPTSWDEGKTRHEFPYQLAYLFESYDYVLTDALYVPNLENMLRIAAASWYVLHVDLPTPLEERIQNVQARQARSPRDYRAYTAEEWAQRNPPPYDLLDQLRVPRVTLERPYVQSLIEVLLYVTNPPHWGRPR